MVAGLSIFFTLSRSGLIEFFVIFLSYLCFAIFSSKKRLTFSPKRFLGLLFFLAIIATFFLTVIPKVIEESNLFTSGSAQSRLGLLSGRGGVEDASGESRYKAILESLELINESPIVGHGTAHSRQMKELPHNMYLNQWVNNGILGLSCYVVFLITSFMTFRKRKFVPGQVFVLVAVVGSFFSHNVLDHRPFLILFGMMATLSLPKEKV